MHSKAIEAGARALIYDADLDPDVFKGMHGSYGHFMDTAQSCIAAYLAAMEAEGFVLVPVEPSEKMQDEAEFVKESCSTCHLTAWSAMLAARPNVKG